MYRIQLAPGLTLLACLSLLVSAGSAARADDRASMLLQQVVANYRAMKSLTADFTVHQEVAGMKPMDVTGTAKAARPNLYVIDFSGNPPMRMISDGKTALFVVKPNLAYCSMPAGGIAMNIGVSTVAPLTLFYNPGKLTAPDTPTKYIGTETWEGRTYDIVEQTLGATTMRFYISLDHLIPRIKVHLEWQGQRQEVDAAMRHIRIDAPVTAEDLDTTPPPGARPFEMPGFGGKPLAVGDTAPDFALPRPDGGEISLPAARGARATVVTFWFYECAGCRQELPWLQKLYAELKPKGVEIIAVNSNNEAKVVAGYLRRIGATFPVGLDDTGSRHSGVAKQYGISLYPTAYVLDSAGKVAARLVAPKEDELREALRKLGVTSLSR